MTIAARFERWSPWLTRTTGVLLILLGVIHLIATPLYIGWASRALLPGAAQLVASTMQLNHILAGILLIPLGLSTFWAGSALQEAWAFRLAAMNALVTLALPVLLVLTVPWQTLDAVPFRLAMLVLVLACLTQICALGGVWMLRRRKLT